MGISSSQPRSSQPRTSTSHTPRFDSEDSFTLSPRRKKSLSDDSDFLSNAGGTSRSTNGRTNLKEQMCEALRAVPFFIDLNDDEIERLANHFKLIVVRHENKVLYSKEQSGRFHIILRGSVQLSTFKEYESGTTIGPARKPVECILCHRSKHAYFGELHLMNRMQQRKKRFTSRFRRWWSTGNFDTREKAFAPLDSSCESQQPRFSSPQTSYSGHSNPSIPIDLESDICQKLQEICVKSSEPCVLMRLERKKFRLERGSALYSKIQNRIIEFSTFYTCTRIRSIPFFEKIHHGDRAKLEQLASLFTAKVVPIGSHICVEGEETDTFCVIVSGCAVVTVLEQDGNVTELRKLVPGNYCGEVALLNSESKRTATITALDQCLVLCLHRKDFTNFIGVEPSVCDDLLSKARQRIIEKTACKVDLFSGFNKKTLEKLAHVSYLRTVPPKTSIFREGDENADFFYLIVEGQVDVWQKKKVPQRESLARTTQPSIAFSFSCWISSCAAEFESQLGEAVPETFEESEHLCTLHASQYFGEIALVSDLPRTATVATSNERCTLLEFNKRDFISIFTHDRISLAELEIRLLAEKTRLCHILLHPVGQQLFHDFLCSEYSQESVDFWKDAERFRSVFTSSNRISTQAQGSSVRTNGGSSVRSEKSNPLASILGQSKKDSLRAEESSPQILRRKSLRQANMEQEALKIYEKYIAESSPNWVNISGTVRREISEKVQNTDIDEKIFQTAQEEIYELMEKDPFQRFKGSECFGKLLETVGAYTRGNEIDHSRVELEMSDEIEK